MTYRKKLIEVALPLDAINAASAREKSIRHGHPSTLHLWWARRPLATARAVIFAQMVDDPSGHVDTLLCDPAKRRAAQRELEQRLAAWRVRVAAHEAAGESGDRSVPAAGAEPTLRDCIADLERERLFAIIRQLVLWENTTNDAVLEQARAEIWQSWRAACADNVDHPRAKELFDRFKLPAFHDPFAGGGTLPLEAQRLGLEAFASDLNPVAVLISKAMIEIPPKFAGRPPVNPAARKEAILGELRGWKGAQGLAEDVRYYGQWIRNEAERRIGHLYPRIEITNEMAKARLDLKPLVGRKLVVTAWLWARTVKSPNPAFATVQVPLASTFMLSTKPGKETYIEPLIDNEGYQFVVKLGKPLDAEATKRGTKAGTSGSSFLCVMSGTPMPFEYLRNEAKSGRMGTRLMALVAEGDRRRVYLSPTSEMEAVARTAQPADVPDTELPKKALGFRVQEYGMTRWRDVFSPRQLVALTTFSDLVQEIRERIRNDAIESGVCDDKKGIAEGGTGASAYADAVSLYQSFTISKVADRGSSLTRWMPTRDSMYNTFSRQAVTMSWDFVEVNAMGEQTGGYAELLRWTAEAIEGTAATSQTGTASQLDVAQISKNDFPVISTDPPYYDNIGYADLSDFFYVWLRRSMQQVFPELFATLTVPKAAELVASPDRHGGKQKAEAFFLMGMTKAMHRLAEQAHPAFPVTIYYAFKQAVSDSDAGTASIGWDTFLDAVIRSGLAITGTWPVRTELANRMRGAESNALASSIVLVCRKQAISAPTATRREFLSALKADMPEALSHLQRGNIAPVDLAQAAIGSGMAVYTRYARVLGAEGHALSVREALALINQTLDEALADQEGDFDADSRWALAWFEQSGFAEGLYGVAETLSKAKNTSVAGMVEAGIVVSKSGKVRLLTPPELGDDWDPITDLRVTIWEAVHHLIRALEAGGARTAAASAWTRSS